MAGAAISSSGVWGGATRLAAFAATAGPAVAGALR